MKISAQRSLRTKVGRIITAFSFVLVVFYSYMLLLLKDSGLRDATHGVLLHEAELFAQAYKRDRNAALPDSYSLQGFIGMDNLPADITSVFPPAERPQWHQRQKGIYYRLTVAEKTHTHHHLLARALPDSDEELLLYYQLTTAISPQFDIWRNVKQTALLGFVLVIVMLLVLHRFIYRALKPISSLSHWIEDLNDQQAPRPLPNDLQDDEIGQLARSLFDALERISASNERERAFLRNASHELRTPIAIIRNTLDVLEHKKGTAGNPDIERLLARIRRASDTMKAVTEAILWLAVDEYVTPEQSETDLRSLVEALIEDNQNLIDANSVSVSSQVESLGCVKAEPALLHITLDNLIRNAFQHCSRGEIKVSSQGSHTIQISNSRSQDAGHDQRSLKTGSFGLGLALVQKIAEKKHWTFDFRLDRDYACATLDFGTLSA